jgi:hypothetical protein
VEGRRLTSGTLLKKVRIGGLAMSLETPEKTGNFQRKLYAKAKADAGMAASGSMSGEGERGVAEWPKLPRLSATLPYRTAYIAA